MTANTTGTSGSPFPAISGNRTPKIRQAGVTNAIRFSIAAFHLFNISRLLYCIISYTTPDARTINCLAAPGFARFSDIAQIT